MEFNIINCFWLMIPIIVWNYFFYKKQPEIIISSSKKQFIYLSKLISVVRAFLLVSPILLPINLNSIHLEFGVLIYLIGLVFYFFTWIPKLFFSDSKLYQNPIVLVLPAFSPIFPLLGISLISSSFLFGIVSFIYIGICIYREIKLYSLVKPVHNKVEN